MLTVQFLFYLQDLLIYQSICILLFLKVTCRDLIISVFYLLLLYMMHFKLYNKKIEHMPPTGQAASTASNTCSEAAFQDLSCR